MAEAPTLTKLQNLQNDPSATTAINGNFSAIATAFEDVLSLSGTTPNQMKSNLDMNSFQILNLPVPATADSPLRLQDLNTFIGGGTVTNIPSGGTAGEVLTKRTNTDYDVIWTSVLDTFNVKSFGAKGDGVTADDVAINSALTAIRAAGGGILWFPYGTYSVASAISVVATSNLIIDGDPGVVIKATAAFNASDNLLKSSVISGLNFTGTATPTGYVFNNILITENITVDASNGNLSGLPGGASLGFNMCTIEIMNVDNVSIYATSIGGFGNGPVISTQDPRLTAPTFTGWTLGTNGTGYAINDIFVSNDVGNQFAKAEFQVSSVGVGGSVQSVVLLSRGIYLTINGANATTTNITGTGSGCTLQLTGSATVRNGILNPVMDCDVINCVRGVLPQYGSISGSGMQIGAAYDAQVNCRFTNVGGPAIDMFNCYGGSAYADVRSVSATPIGTLQQRGSFHSDFGLANMHLSGKVPSVQLKGGMSSGLSFFFNGGTATPGPVNCFMDFDVDGKLAIDTYSPGITIQGGSVTGAVGQAANNFGRFKIANSNADALDLYDCYSNHFDVIVHEPGTATGLYKGVKLFSQIDQIGGGCISNDINLFTRDNRSLLENNVTTDGTTRHSNNYFQFNHIAPSTSTSINLAAGSYTVGTAAGFTTTATAAGTTVLTSSSPATQIFTGFTTQTVTLPVASTMALGQTFYFYNDSTGVVTVNSSGSNIVVVMAANTSAVVVCQLNSGTSAASWEFRYSGFTAFGGKVVISQNSLTFSGTDGSTVAFGTGGTAAYKGTDLSQFAATTSAQLAGVLSDEVSATGVSAKALFGTAGNLPATATNDNAVTGNVGEYIESVITSGSSVALVTNTSKTVTSITLGAGDWDVSGMVSFFPANTTSVTALQGSLSLTTNTIDTTPGRFNSVPMSTRVYDGATVNTVPFPPYRFSLSTSTTVFIIANSSFTVSTNNAFGILRARRVR